MRIISCAFHLCRSQIRFGYIQKPHFNEKYFSSIGSVLAEEARSGLNEAAEAKAELNFKTFMSLINHWNPKSPYDKAIDYLNVAGSTCNLQTMASKTKTDTSGLITIPSEIFTSAIVYDLMAGLPGIDSRMTESLLDLIEFEMNSEGLFTYFSNKCINNDVDDTSVCLWALLQSKRLRSTSKLARSVAKVISMNTTPDTLFPDTGKSRQVIQTYLPPFNSVISVGKSSGKLDPVVMSNSLRLLYFFQMADLATDTQNCVHDWLLDDHTFNSGGRTNESPDTLLYFLSNSLQLSPQADFKFRHVLIKRLEERLGKTDSAMNQAKRILTAYNLGLIEPTTREASSQRWTQNKLNVLGEEREKLVKSQTSDGSWPLEPLYRQATGPIRFYNRTALTAFAAKALHVSRNVVS